MTEAIPHSSELKVHLNSSISQLWQLFRAQKYIDRR